MPARSPGDATAGAPPPGGAGPFTRHGHHLRVAPGSHPARGVPAAGVAAAYTAGAGSPGAGTELYAVFSQGGRWYYRECTAGFDAVSPATGQAYLTTAGHCFQPGSTVWHAVGSTGRPAGAVTARAGYGTLADVELIPAPAGTRPATVTIGGWQHPVTGYVPRVPVGTAVCKDGIATGQTCGNVVTHDSVTVCYQGQGCIAGQEAAYNPRLARTASYGDSGGPVYTYGPGGAVTMAGIVSGFGDYCTGGQCYFDGVMYFTPAGNIRRALGVVPAVSGAGGATTR